MADVMVIDVEDYTPRDSPVVTGSDRTKKSLKRKRPTTPSMGALATMSVEEREARIDGLNKELDGLFKYFKETLSKKVDLGLSNSSSSVDGVIACLIEESELPLSKLVEVTYEKIKDREGFSVTMASVKSSVIFVGQRLAYGVPNANADVLEDDTDSCLWCWETRDLKFLSKSVRGAMKIRRICRKKIHERITAISAMLATLQNSENDHNNKHNVMKASEKLFKVLAEADIRLLVDTMSQKNDAEMAENEVKRGEKQLIKQLELSKREAEKEKKRLERELEKEKCQNEKEQKRLHEEAEKRREKEEAEMRKLLKKQQEEAEKEQRRREKEEAESKKQRSVQKQASILERFLNKKKDNSLSLKDQSSNKVATPNSTIFNSEKHPEAVTFSMDCALSQNDDIDTDDIRKSHFNSWKHLGQNMRSNTKQSWGIRRKPKTAVVKELKLVDVDKLGDIWQETVLDDRTCQINTNESVSCALKSYRHKQLLQFDKSHRPAFYGIWPKKSTIVRPHTPFKMDPDLDYDIDSDEEWEEEEPGESLSDCEKDNEEESLEEGCIKADDEDESEDGFFVPDGYLSENEGVQVNSMETDSLDDECKSTPNHKLQVESEDLCLMFKQQKYLRNLTEHALRKNQPLIILNLMHEKNPLIIAEDLNGTKKVEQMCLQALCIRSFPNGSSIEVSTDNGSQDEYREVCVSNNNGGSSSSTPVAAVSNIVEADLPKIVDAIRSHSQGMTKVVDALQQTFPAISKTQLRNKVREISDFAENRWQVKKEILDKLGISVSPARSRKTKSIATFFSKRCMPLSGRDTNPIETSPDASQKQIPAVADKQVCVENLL